MVNVLKRYLKKSENEIVFYPSINQAERETGFNHSGIIFFYKK